MRNSIVLLIKVPIFLIIGIIGTIMLIVEKIFYNGRQ